MFEFFSKINYSLNGQTLELTDIFKSIKIDSKNTTDFNTTKNTNFERPDQLAQKIYGDPKLFWVHLALNGIKNPFREWFKSDTTQSLQNNADYDTKIFQFGNISNYLPGSTNPIYFALDDTDSYTALSSDFSNIEKDDIILFETGSGSFKLRTYGAGQVSGLNDCSYPHFGQSIIPDNFLNRNNIVQISSCGEFTACLDDLGYIWVWGFDHFYNSGFINEGTLYKSPYGGFKHIDTTSNKILAVNTNGDIECFGDCGGWVYGGQTDIKKSFWTSGITLAGIGIKNDDSIIVFGPIVSTNNLLQYCSSVSCADSYCLGVVTGPQSNGTVIGFGQTGFFSQIGQNTFYSKQLTALEPIPTTNPIYPFSDSQNQIIKNYADGVLEVSINDLLPFTSPTGVPEEAYRSDYYSVYGSDDLDRSLIGFTDKDVYSKEGFILNDPKTFAGNGLTLYENRIYEYTQFYDENRKPFKLYDFYKTSQTKYLGISFINGVNFAKNFSLYTEDETFSWFGLPETFAYNNYFDIKYADSYYNSRVNTNSYFGHHIKYAKIYGVSFINNIGNSNIIVNDTSALASGLTLLDMAHIEDGIVHDLFITSDRKISKIMPLTLYASDKTHVWPDNLYSASRRYLKAWTNNSDPGGITIDFRLKDDFFDNIGPLKSWSRSADHGLWIVDQAGQGYFITVTEALALWADFAVWAGLSPEDFFRRAFLPPPGHTFEKIEAADASGFWTLGRKNNGELMIWGLTADLEWIFGITQSPYTFAGITAKDIHVNGDNFIALKENGTICMLGGTTFMPSIEEWFGGFTVNNATQIVGPTTVMYVDHMFVKTADNRFKHAYPPKDNLWEQLGFTLGGLEWPKTNTSYIDYLRNIYNPTTLNVVPLLQNNDILSIKGSSNNCTVEKINGDKIQVIGMPVAASSTLRWFETLEQLLQEIYGFDQKKIKRLSGGGSFWGNAYYTDESGIELIAQPGLFYSNIPANKQSKFFVSTPADETNYGPFFGPSEIPASASYSIVSSNTNVNNGIKKGALDGSWNPSYWAFETLESVSYQDLYGLVYGGATLEAYGANQYGLFSVFTVNDKTTHPLVITPKQFKYGYTTPSIKNNYKNIVVGNGFIITLNPDDTMTFVCGDKTPHNYISDFSNLSTFNTVLIGGTTEEYEFWEDSIVEKIAIGGDRFYTYQPSYARNYINYWGAKDETNSITPPGLTYQQIDCFYTHCCGIRQDGKIECWGTDNTGIWVQQQDGTIISGLLAVPTNLGPCTKIAVGYNHNCAEDVFGNVSCWGLNEYGQTNVPASVNDGTSNLILDCGQYFSVVQKTDGRIIAWGIGISGPSQSIPLGNAAPTELELE